MSASASSTSSRSSVMAAVAAGSAPSKVTTLRSLAALSAPTKEWPQNIFSACRREGGEGTCRGCGQEAQESTVLVPDAPTFWRRWSNWTVDCPLSLSLPKALMAKMTLRTYKASGGWA